MIAEQITLRSWSDSKIGLDAGYISLKVYQPDARRILHEARQGYAALLDGPGYSREQAAKDFQDIQTEISRYL